MVSRHPGFSLAVALVLLPAALPAAPHLVKDLNTVPIPLFNYGDVEFTGRGSSEGVTYFTAPDPAHGIELWRSDGTPGGTERLTDICAGVCSSMLAGSSEARITVHAGRVFFWANDGFSGDELWVSDGTPGSERRVRDLCPGPCSIYPSPIEVVGDRLLFFSYFREPERHELWQTDGTREGTVRVKVLCTGDCYGPGDLVPIGERALFVFDGVELWATDGTAGGTRFLRQLGFDIFGFNPSLIPGDGFGWVWDSAGLWRTDGTAAGTFLLKRIDELTEPSAAYAGFVLWHGLLFGTLGSGEIIRSDGTPEGTFQLASFPGNTYVGSLTPLDDEVLFQVFKPEDPSSHRVLWSTRGTAETTGPKLVLTAVEPSGLTSLGNDRAVFVAGPDFFEKKELWVTDGTEAGTRQLAVPPGFGHNRGFFPTGDGRALFFREAPRAGIWVTDGTEAGTREVRSFHVAPGPSGPLEQAALGGKLVFSALEADWTALLYVSDGTAAGTGLLSERATSAASFFLSGDRLLFSAIRPRRSYPDIWATDGTPAGTERVSHSGFSNPVRFGSQILFRGSAGFVGEELMKTDSLARNVELVKDIDPFIVERAHHQCVPESSGPVFGGVVGGRMLLAADDGRSGRELWASDGTWAGTVQVRDINPGRTPESPPLCPDLPLGPHRHDLGLSSDPRSFVLLGSVALFSADDGRSGRELWITNGTFRGTRRLVDLVPGVRGSEPHDLVRFQGRVYFLAANSGQGGQGESLWRTDGTARGTTRVRDLALDGMPSWGRRLTVAGGRLFLTVFNETTGAELWASTGETEGTGMVADLNPGPGHSSPQSLTAVGGLLLFAADDGLTGLEPWRTDGTAAGTVRVGDIAPGRDASSPGPFTTLPSIVMTGADDGIHGREPWAIPRTEIEIDSEIFQPE